MQQPALQLSNPPFVQEGNKLLRRSHSVLMGAFGRADLALYRFSKDHAAALALQWL